MAKTRFNCQKFLSANKFSFKFKSIDSVSWNYLDLNTGIVTNHALSKKLFWFNVRFQESQKLFSGMLDTTNYDRATNLVFFLVIQETYYIVQDNKLTDLAPYRVQDPKNIAHQGL